MNIAVANMKSGATAPPIQIIHFASTNYMNKSHPASAGADLPK